MDRASLEAPLSAFLREFPNDGRARLARVYLAWIYIDEGQLDRGRRFALPARRGRRGATRDFADVAEAAARIRLNEPELALKLLEPLRGKVIDPSERLLFGEQLVRALIAAHRWLEAVLVMEEWLVDSADQYRDSVRARIATLLRKVPNEGLERGLAALEHQSRESVADSSAELAKQWLRDRITRRLLDAALSSKDAELARRLLELRGLDSTVEQRTQLARLATRGRPAPRIRGRTIGLVLSTKTARGRRRSAELAAGLMTALDLPAPAGRTGHVELITAQDTGGDGGMAAALSELAGLGATILIAGVESDGASAALDYAESASVPVLLAAVPKAHSSAHRFGFVLGVTPGAQMRALQTSRQLASQRLVTVDAEVCGRAAAFPAVEWRRERADAVVLLGPADCATRLSNYLRQARFPIPIALGLEASALSHRAPPGVKLALASGMFPLHADIVNHVAPSKSMREWNRQKRRGPTWYQAVGHDAGSLVKSGLNNFPTEQTDDPQRVAELHRRAQARLASARTRLWTTDARGFATGRRLARRVRVVVVKRASP